MTPRTQQCWLEANWLENSCRDKDLGVLEGKKLNTAQAVHRQKTEGGHPSLLLSIAEVPSTVLPTGLDFSVQERPSHTGEGPARATKVIHEWTGAFFI